MQRRQAKEWEREIRLLWENRGTLSKAEQSTEPTKERLLSLRDSTNAYTI